MAKIFYIFLILLVNFASAAMLSLRYRYLFSFLGHNISRTSSFIILSITNSLNYLIPFKVGLLVGGPLAPKIKEKISIYKGSVVFAFGQLFEIIWQLIFILIAILFAGNKFFKNDFLFNLIFAGVVCFFLLYLICRPAKILNVLIRFYGFFPEKLKKLIRSTGIKRDKTNNIFKDLKTLFTKKKFLLKYSLRTVTYAFFTPLNLFLILLAFSSYITYINIFMIFWTSFILGKLSGLPGGIGIRDVTIGALLVKFGIPTALTLKIVFLHRILSLFPLLPVGLIWLLYFSKGKMKHFYKQYF